MQSGQTTTPSICTVPANILLIIMVIIILSMHNTMLNYEYFCVSGQEFEVPRGDVRKYTVLRTDVPSHGANHLSWLSTTDHSN